MELLRRTKAGDQEARRELIEGNLRLVLSVIQRFAGRGENADDLFQVGCVGVVDTDKCIGCGACHEACPSFRWNACG